MAKAIPHEQSVKPKSSATIIRKFGRLSAITDVPCRWWEVSAASGILVELIQCERYWTEP